MERIHLPRLKTPRPSRLGRLLGCRLLWLVAGGWLLWSHAPVELVEQVGDEIRSLAGWPSAAETDGLSDEQLTGAWQPRDAEIDADALDFFEPVIELLFGDAEIRDGRVHLDGSQRYESRLAEIDET